MHARQAFGEQAAEHPLVLGVGVGVQQHDGDRLGLLGGDGGDDAAAASSARASIGPSGPARSGTPTRRSLGTSGGGAASQSRYRLGRAWRPSSTMSSKPAVAASTVRAPTPLQERVGRHRHAVDEAGDVRCLRLRPNEHGVGGGEDRACLVVRACSGPSPSPPGPRVTRTASVNVPPTSTPSSIGWDANAWARCAGRARGRFLAEHRWWTRLARRDAAASTGARTHAGRVGAGGSGVWR